MIKSVLIPIVATGAGFALFRAYVQGPSIPKKVFDDADLQGGVAIVTGASPGGIGAETCKAIAALERAPDVLIITTRSKAAGEKAREEILAHARTLKSNIKDDAVVVAPLDLADLDNVKSFAEEIQSKGYAVKLLVLNAGVMACPHDTTKQGIEVQWGTNHLGHFYLTKLLFDNLKQNNARVVAVSSRAGERAKTFDLSDSTIFGPATHQNRMELYSRSKFSNYLFARELQERFEKEGSSAVAVSLHPGVIASRLFSNFVPSYMLGFASFLTTLLLKTPEAGARTSVTCALTRNPVPGAYYKDCAPAVNGSPLVKDQDRLQKELWSRSEEVLQEALATKRE